MALLLVPMASEAEAALGDEWSAIKATLGDAYSAETTEESLKLLADARSIYMSEFQEQQEHMIQQHMKLYWNVMTKQNKIIKMAITHKQNYGFNAKKNQFTHLVWL